MVKAIDVTDSRNGITGVILAGGRAERMGGRDKGLLTLASEPLVAHVIRRLRPQVAEVLISANRNLDEYRRFGCRVIVDADQGFRGPLAGILAAMGVAATPYVLTVPCDSPLPPPDYAGRMRAALEREGALLGVACCEGCWQPVFALAPVHLRDDLAFCLARGENGVGRWLRRHRLALVEFPDWPALFRNVNTPEDLARLEVEWAVRKPSPERDEHD